MPLFDRDTTIFRDEDVLREDYQPDSIQERDEELAETYALDAETTSPSGNCYTMPDGTVVDADTPLYDPTVVTDDPGSTFDDYPGE